MKVRKTKTALLMSVLALVMCFTMLIGTTYAWFTDSVSSGTNKLIAGNLDVELTHKNATVTTAETVEGKTNLFKINLWEPGAYTYEVFTVSNVGTLALKYQISAILDTTVLANGYNTVVSNDESNGKSLLDVLRVKEIAGDNAPTARPTYSAADGTLLKDYLGGTSVKSAVLQPNASATTTVVIYWPQSEDDNIWDLKNGKYASDATAETVGQLKVDFAVKLIASQYTVEEDSFGHDYDEGSTYPTSASATTVYTQNAATTVSIPSVGSAKIPAGTALEANGAAVADNTELVLTVEETEDNGNIAVAAGDSTTSYEVTLEAITASGNYKVSSTDNAIITKLYIGMVDLTGFYHNDTAMTAVASEAEVDANGEYYYDLSTGYITMATTSFSPFTSVYKFNGGIGTEAYPYLIANREQLVAINTLSWNYYAMSIYDGNNWSDCVAFANSKETKDAYYKMEEANMTIDATGMPFLYLDGCFDGNGVTFNNLSRALFYESSHEGTCVIKNITVNANIARNSYFESAVLLYPDNDITLQNITVHGYIEGTVAASYIAMGPYEVINYKFVDCHSDATIVATGESAAAFIGHPYCKDGSTITIENSYFDGAMTAKDNCNYFRVNYSGSLTVTTDGTRSDLYTNPASSYTGNADVGVKYKAGTKLTTTTITAPEGINYITVPQVEGAAYAVATLNIGPNGTDEKGNYMGVFMSETINPVDGSFKTSEIKNFNVTVNGTATTETGVSADGTTFNVVRSSYGTTYGSAFVRIIQYNESGEILQIATLSL